MDNKIQSGESQICLIDVFIQDLIDLLEGVKKEFSQHCVSGLHISLKKKGYLFNSDCWHKEKICYLFYERRIRKLGNN